MCIRTLDMMDMFMETKLSTPGVPKKNVDSSPNKDI